MWKTLLNHSRELTTEDLQKLTGFTEHNSGEKEQDQDDTMPTSEIKERLTAWDNEETDVHISSPRTELLHFNSDDREVPYFKKLLIERRKSAQHKTVDSFFRKRTR
jgi:hypothetical protein